MDTNSLHLRFDMLANDQRTSLIVSAEGLLASALSSMTEGSVVPELVDITWPILRTANVLAHNVRPSLRLVPLSRLGALEGKSGAKVFVAYFVDGSDKSSGGTASSIYPSLPMVVKLFFSTGSKDPCREEFLNANSIRAFCNYEIGRFALPIYFSEAGSDRPYSVLWSPFSSTGTFLDSYDRNAAELKLQVEDFRSLLPPNGTDSNQATSVLERVYQALSPLHHSGGFACRRTVLIQEEYQWYLRDVQYQSNHGCMWRACWGSETRISDLGQQWVNPFSVLSKLKTLRHSLYFGAIHGDLHPRNIVFTHRTPTLIDFGWAQYNSHVIKDFVLMELNLRFVVLPAGINQSSLDAFASWIGFDDRPPMEVALSTHIELVGCIRRLAVATLPKDTDWDLEYIVPMFFVAMGLLKYAESFDNHVALRLTILRLADYIEKRGLAPTLETP